LEAARAPNAPFQDAFYEHRLAFALRANRDAARALVEDRLALESYRKGYREEDDIHAWPLTGEGEDLILLGRPREAIAPLERAEALRVQKNARAFDLAETRFALAEAVWNAGGDRARAV